MTLRGDKIRSLRRDRELTAEQLAVKAGITVSHLYRLERGESTNPKLRVLEGLATALGVEIADLVG